MNEKQKAWNDYRETLGNIGVTHAKIVREAFMEGYDSGINGLFGETCAQVERRRRAEQQKAPVIHKPPALHIVKTPSDSD